MSKNLDLNTATEQELTGIQGIGKDHAKKIIDYRNQNGPFKSWEDLKRIPGILRESRRAGDNELSRISSLQTLLR